MTRSASKHPTELELEILKILWDHGPLPVRAVRDALAPVRDLAYTTVMTTMGIMVRKGYLKRRKEGNGYIYRPALNRSAATKRILGDVVDRLFEGSPATAALHLLESSELDAEEMARLRALVDRKLPEEDES